MTCAVVYILTTLTEHSATLTSWGLNIHHVTFSTWFSVKTIPFHMVECTMLNLLFCTESVFNKTLIFVYSLSSPVVFHI